MVVAELKMGSVVLPRIESPQVISRLAEFEWFHKIDSQEDTVTPEIDDLLLRAQQTYQRIDEVVKGLGVPPQIGIMEILFKGTTIKRKKYEVDEIAGIIDDLEQRVPGMLEKSSGLLDEMADTGRRLDEYKSLQEMLVAVKKLDVDIGGLGGTRYFYTNLFVINKGDYGEIERTLDDAVLYRFELDGKAGEAVLVVSGAEYADTVLKVMRSFNANPFVIPEDMPQVPSEAYELASSKIRELEKRRKTLAKEIVSVTKSVRGDIMSIHEAAKVAKDVLETMRKPGGTRHFAVIQGYIPRSMEAKFKKATSGWTSLVEDITDPGLKERAPTLFENKRFVRTFEVITNSQGVPKRGEEDPTPMIAMMWPIFYGIMFADLGHGLLLMGLGLLFKVKGQGVLARWGMLIAISGAAAAIAGVGAGEAFGYHIDHLGPFTELMAPGGPLHAMSWIVGILSVAELTFDQVIDILKVSLFLGIIHLVWAMILRMKSLARRGEKIALYMEAIPNLTLYGGIVVIMMCAIGSQYDVMNMYSKVHTEPVPWVTIFLGEWAQVWIVTRIAAVVVIASMVLMMIGGIMHAKRHKDSGGDPASVVMEVFLGKTVEALAHTISYARIGIMLLVHAALLLTVNNAYATLGGIGSPGALAMIIGGNLGIMMIEGLIVYIQSLRLHLYEFFTKWYDGGAEPFRQVRPELIYNQFVWKPRN